MSEYETPTLLGSLLVASGAITQEELAEALRRQHLRGGLLGEVLIDMGALAPRQLERALQTQRRLRGGEADAGPFILVVDDDPEVGALLGDILTGAGHRVGVASDAGEALAMVMSVDACRPALIVLDLGLPGTSGARLLAQLRQDSVAEHTPVMVLTGRPDLEPELRARGLEVSRVLGKPVSARKLISEVESVLSEARGAAPRAVAVGPA